MGAADYNISATLLRDDGTTDALTGSRLENWVAVGTWNVNYSPLTAREQLIADQIQSDIEGKIRGRYRTDLRDTWRIRFTDRTGEHLYAINGITDPDNKHVELVCTVQEL